MDLGQIGFDDGGESSLSIIMITSFFEVSLYDFFNTAMRTIFKGSLDCLDWSCAVIDVL